MEISLKHLPVRQLDPPSPLLTVLRQHSLVVLPVILKVVEVGVVERTHQSYWVVVVYLADAVELVLGPVALIGQFPSLVV